MRRVSYAVLLASLVTFGACDASVTELIVVIDSDLLVPGELDDIRVDLVGPGGEVRQSESALTSTAALPLTLGLVHRGGPLGPVRVTVTGRHGGSDLVQRRATTSFVAGQILVLRVHLLRKCLDVRCASNATCADGACRPIEVPRSELEPWVGAVSAWDASMPDADDDRRDVGACVVEAELCNGIDDDCDGTIDEGFDPRNCGRCGAACTPDPPNATAVCAMGECGVVCDLGFADCNHSALDGCEASLGDPTSCGSCAVTCVDSTSSCVGDATSGFGCASSCSATTTACGDSCVDTTTSTLHCGGCNMACASRPRSTSVCVGGTCGLRCEPGRGDCNGMAIDGCERGLDNDDHNCGMCGRRCERGEHCCGGTCSDECDD